jgi:putative DNA primase/helicase
MEVEGIKSAAAGKWPEILAALGGLSPEHLDGKHHPCPKCGGRDRFRMIDVAVGALLCNQCFSTNNGDGFAAVQWLMDCDFSNACRAIAAQLGLDRPMGNIVAVYDYADEQGALLFQVVRREPKDFRQRRPDGDNNWTWKLGQVRRVLYRLPELLTADPSALVFVCEGEKDCDRLAALGLVATTNSGGAEKWRDEYSESLRGRRVVIVPDNDQPGERHAAQVAASLRGIAASVRILRLPSLPAKGDVSDWLAAGGTAKELLRLAQATSPESDSPARQEAPHATASRKANRVSTPRLVRLADVTPQPVAWLWPARIALGKLTVLAGEPGLGKSFLTMDIAARVTTGRDWPDEDGNSRQPGSVILLSAEDDLADTIRPRLDAAGADVRRVVALQGVEFATDGDKPAGQRCFNLESDLPALEEAIAATPDCRLIVIDPISAYLGGKDSHKNAEIRGLLTPLTDLAAKTNAAVLAVTHLSKGANMKALHRVTGSIAFIAAARAGWLVEADRNDADRRLLLPIKNNLAENIGGLSFKIVEGAVSWEPGTVDLTADQALNEDGSKGSTVVDEAATWLTRLLSERPRSSQEVRDAAEAEMIAPSALRRAKEKLGVLSSKDGFQGEWLWTLPTRSHSLPAKDVHLATAL